MTDITPKGINHLHIENVCLPARAIRRTAAAHLRLRVPLINKPKILFADEPTANRDSVSSRQILELFRKLFRDMGQTILVVTHEPRGRWILGPG